MSATWSFNKSTPSDVEQEVTQIEQFDNDDIDLGNSLVREVIQNSMDARNGSGPVEVHFSIQDLSDLGTRKVEMLRDNLNPIQKHLEACKKSIPIDKKVRLLCIEDFNTKGLTGVFDRKDGDNFSNFWRVMGKSGKKGEAGGRRGLGKLVFSACSKIRAFYGVTRREDDECLFAMGHVILKTHTVDGTEYKPHGFWHNGRSRNKLELQLPTREDNDLQNLHFISKFKRTEQSGFSIIIPYIRDNITSRNLIDNVLENYYFPILSGQLTVRVDTTVINANTFNAVYKKSKNVRLAIPLDFITTVSDLLRSKEQEIRTNTVDIKRFPKNLFSKKQIASMKERFRNNEMIHVVLPIMLRENGSNFDYKGEYNLFLRSLRKNDQPFKFFARGPITLPSERRRFNGSCHAGMIAKSDDVVASFLGDAENPSHTQWNSNAELLKERWQSPQRPLKVIRDSLQELYNLVAKQEESKNNDILSKFFSLPKKISGPRPVDPEDGSGGEGGSTNFVPTGLEIKPSKNGFILQPDHKNRGEKDPKRLRVEMAYDRVGGNALGHYSKLDFDLHDKDTIDIDYANGDVKIDESNVLEMKVNSSDFSLHVRLKDLNRDLFVKASVLEWTTPKEQN